MNNIIVKMQIPIGGNDPNAEALVYDRTREIMFSIIIDEHVKEMMGNKPKKYFELNLKNGEIKFGKEVKAQSW